MKRAIIDIGSNSVRMAIFADGNIIFRDKITSMLGENIATTSKLDEKAVERNIQVIDDFCKTAMERGVFKKDIFPFATAAVRQTENGGSFVAAVKQKIGVTVKVLSEKEECEVALSGALGDSDGAVLDVGGASSELIVKRGGKIVYEKSLAEGAVKLTDEFSEEVKPLSEYLKKVVETYNAPKITALTAIGGSATCVGYIVSGDKTYQREKNHGRFVPITDLYATLLRIKEVPPQKRSEVFDIEKSRAKTIFSGGMLIYAILKYLGLDGFKVSEKDNIEGYYNYLKGIKT